MKISILRRQLDRPYLLLTLTTAFWGANSVLGKLAVGEISPALLSLLRWAFGAVVLAVVAGRQIRADLPLLRTRVLYLLAMGAVGFTGFSALNYLALHFTSAVNASIEQSCLPPLILLGAWALFKAPIRPLQIVGVIVSMAGVVVVATHGRLATLATLEINRGDALMLLACTLYAAYSVFLRLRPAVHPSSLMAGFCLGATIAALPVVAAEAMLGHSVPPTLIGWAIVAFAVLFPTLLSQMFFAHGVQLIGAARAGVFINLVPIFGALLSVVTLGESFEIYHGVGLALALGGIALAESAARGLSSSGQAAVRPDSAG